MQKSTTGTALATATLTNAPAKEEEKKLPLLAGVQHQLTVYVNRGELTFREDFNQGNAMVSAKVALIEMGVLDAQGNPTGTCTNTSLVNAIFDSMVQGMNVSKDQGYFINRNKTLSFMRSYHGDKNLGEHVLSTPGFEAKIYDGVILKGEKFKPVQKMTRRGIITTVEDHELAWPRVVTRDNIQGAYAGATLTNLVTGEFEDLGIELMTMEQIENSWKKSQSMGPGSMHNMQPDIACKRTVIRRFTKKYISASTDALLKQAVQRQELDAIEAEVTDEIEERGNQQALTAPPAEATEQKPVDETTGEVTESGEPF